MTIYGRPIRPRPTLHQILANFARTANINLKAQRRAYELRLRTLLQRIKQALEWLPALWQLWPRTSQLG